MTDPMGVQDELLSLARSGPKPFGDLVAGTALPAIGRAHALHLIWHRRLCIDLAMPLMDATLVRPVAAEVAG